MTSARLTSTRRLAALAVVAALPLTLLAPSASVADDSLKDKQKKVQSQIAHAHDDIEHSSTAYRKSAKALARASAALVQARAELAQARAEVTTAQAEDAKMQERLDAAIARLEKVKADLAEGSSEMASQRTEVAEVVSSLYQNGGAELQAASSFLNASNPGEWVRAGAVQDAMVARENRSYGQLRAAKVVLQVKKKSLASAKAEVEDARQAAADHLTLMQDLEASQERATVAVRGMVTKRRGARAAAAKAAAADQATLRKLEAESNAIKEKLRQQALAAGASQTAPPTSNSGGFLSKPVNGYVSSPYGYRTHPIYGYYSLHDGTDFGASCGAPLYATADGVISSSYWSNVYGNRMILDHGIVKGVGLASVYNHATRYVVSAGQRVKRGQVVGYVGSTGWSTGCHLHFTVLLNGSAVQPMNWM